MNQVPIVVAVIRNEEGKFLLTKRHQPEEPDAHNKWQSVGGGIEFGETPEQAIIREVREEIGVEVSVMRMLPTVLSHVWKNSSGSETHILLIAFECKIVSGIPAANMDEEIGMIGYFTPEEIRLFDTLPLTLETVQMVFS